MDKNPESPWNPKYSTNITPEEFEKCVQNWLILSANQQSLKLDTEHLGIANGEGGSYKIDVLVHFSVLGGASIKVLVECKHQTRPIEREDIMVFESKLRDCNAQKAMIFSTSGFQSGALDFASAKNIATITIVNGVWLYETKSLEKITSIPSWIKHEKYSAISLSKPNNSILCSTITNSRLDPINEWIIKIMNESI